MFSNLTKEIIYYSLVPVCLIVVIVLLLILFRKKENNEYKYNYLIKVFLLLIIGLVLPLITGYTIWVYEKFASNNSLTSNILYMVLLGALIVALIILLLINCVKFYKSLKKEEKLSEIE